MGGWVSLRQVGWLYDQTILLFIQIKSTSGQIQILRTLVVAHVKCWLVCIVVSKYVVVRVCRAPPHYIPYRINDVLFQPKIKQKKKCRSYSIFSLLLYFTRKPVITVVLGEWRAYLSDFRGKRKVYPKCWEAHTQTQTQTHEHTWEPRGSDRVLVEDDGN